jgi:translocation and assembly module TamB
MQISGSLKAPVLEGNISTTDTRLTLDAPGITLEKVAMTLKGQPDGNIALNLAAQSGEGQLTIRGEGNLHAKPRYAHFQITGNDFQVMDTREANISASPDLNLTVSGKRLDIDGEIRVPDANIRPRKLPESSVSISADQIIVADDEETASAKDYQVSSRVRFILGNRVKFDGFGLKGRITGNLIAKDRPGNPTTASGELAIHDGNYRAYGQNLDIRTGRLLFAGGPITEPGLDIEAVRRPSPGILVGVKARGNMRKPDFSLFSEPGMSQSDQLSWLVLGRPLESEASSQDRNSMNQAAIMLGLGGGLALTEEYGEKLGIDEISIESDPDDETNQASLLVGKYLSPKLLVSYGVGIFEPVSTLRLRYALGSKWKLVGESSALRSSADLFYVIELGK